MKTFWIVVLISVQVLIGATPGTAAPTIFYDYRDDKNNPDGKPSYWGGYYPFNNEDAVGTRNIDYQWDITKMQIEEVGTKVQVKIFGPWFGAQNSDWFFTKIDPKGANPYGGGLYCNLGDLYISSSGWHPNTNSPHYPNDTFLQSEGWDYVITHRKEQSVIISVMPDATATYTNSISKA